MAILLSVAVGIATLYIFRDAIMSLLKLCCESSVPELKRVAFVIAHPDDEAMFFVPAIAALSARPGIECFLLCLSTGNFDGLGQQRSLELVESAQLLGLNVSGGHVRVMDEPALQDGPQNVWPIEKITHIIVQYAREHKIDTIVSFDERGVSGHPNHIALANGVSALARSVAQSGAVPRCFSLVSVSLLRKYLGLFDLPFALCANWLQNRQQHSGHSLLLLSANPSLAQRCLLAHASQFVWYRRLFVVFSSYVYINTLKSVLPVLPVSA